MLPEVHNDMKTSLHAPIAVVAKIIRPQFEVRYIMGGVNKHTASYLTLSCHILFQQYLCQEQRIPQDEYHLLPNHYSHRDRARPYNQQRQSKQECQTRFGESIEPVEPSLDALHKLKSLDLY